MRWLGGRALGLELWAGRDVRRCARELVPALGAGRRLSGVAVRDRRRTDAEARL